MHAHIDSVTGEMTLNFKCVVFVLGCRCRKVGAAAKDGKTVTTETDRGLSPRSICQLFHCWWWSVHLVERTKPPGLRRCFAQRLLRLWSGLSTDLFTVLGVVAAISAGGNHTLVRRDRAWPDCFCSPDVPRVVCIPRLRNHNVLLLYIMLLLAQDKFVIDYFHLRINNWYGEIDYCIITCQHAPTVNNRIDRQEIGIGEMHRIIIPTLFFFIIFSISNIFIQIITNQLQTDLPWSPVLKNIYTKYIYNMHAKQ